MVFADRWEIVAHGLIKKFALEGILEGDLQVGKHSGKSGCVIHLRGPEFSEHVVVELVEIVGPAFQLKGDASH